MKKLFEKMKTLCLWFVRCSYFIWKYFRSDKIKTQNGRIYSRKQIEKQMRESNIEYCSCTDECLGIYHKDSKCKKLRGYSH